MADSSVRGTKQAHIEETHARFFNSPAEALAYAVECQMATLGHLRGLQRPSKSELRRCESIVRTGLANCRLHVSRQVAMKAGAGRVVEFLDGERDDVGRRIGDG